MFHPQAGDGAIYTVLANDPVIRFSVVSVGQFSDNREICEMTIAAFHNEFHSPSGLGVKPFIANKSGMPHAGPLEGRIGRHDNLARQLVVPGRHPDGSTLLRGLGDAFLQCFGIVGLALAASSKVGRRKRICRLGQHGRNIFQIDQIHDAVRGIVIGLLQPDHVALGKCQTL